MFAADKAAAVCQHTGVEEWGYTHMFHTWLWCWCQCSMQCFMQQIDAQAVQLEQSVAGGAAARCCVSRHVDNCLALLDWGFWAWRRFPRVEWGGRGLAEVLLRAPVCLHSSRQSEQLGRSLHDLLKKFYCGYCCTAAALLGAPARSCFRLSSTAETALPGLCVGHIYTSCRTQSFRRGRPRFRFEGALHCSNAFLSGFWCAAGSPVVVRLCHCATHTALYPHGTQ